VVEAKTGGAETLYEISQLRPHHHLVCRTCGNEQEISNTTMRAMFEEILREHRFQVATDHLVFSGYAKSVETKRLLRRNSDSGFTRQRLSAVTVDCVRPWTLQVMERSGVDSTRAHA